MTVLSRKCLANKWCWFSLFTRVQVSSKGVQYVFDPNQFFFFNCDKFDGYWTCVEGVFDKCSV